MHLSWDDLQTLEALVRTASVVEAARELALRHTTVSRRIEALERTLGATLFLRGARLRPTPLARAIADRAGAMRAGALDIAALIEGERRLGAGKVVITTNEVLAPLLFDALAKVAGGLHFEVLISDTERELEPGVTDLALRPSHTPGGALRGQRLGNLQLGVFQARGSEASEWILPAPGLRERMSMRWWSVIPRDAASRVTCDSLLGLRDACVAGFGRCVLPSFLAAGQPSLELVQKLAVGTPVWLLSPATRRPGAGERNIRSALAAALRTTPQIWME